MTKFTYGFVWRTRGRDTARDAENNILKDAWGNILPAGEEPGRNDTLEGDDANGLSSAAFQLISNDNNWRQAA